MAMKSGNRNFTYLWAVMLTILAYWINKANLVSMSVLIVFVGVVISVFDVKKGCIFFFLVSMAFSDFTYEGVFGAEDADQNPLGGIYMASVGGSTLMVYWSILNLVIIFVKKRSWALKKIQSNKIISILRFVMLFSFIGLFFNLNSTAKEVPQTAVSDVRVFVNVILGFLTVLLIVENREDLKRYFIAFILIFLLQLLLTIISSITVSQVRTIYNFFAGTESYLIGTAFLFLIFNLVNKSKHMGLFSYPLFNIGGMLLIILFLFVVASRGKMVGLAFSILIYLIFTKKIKYAAAIPVLVYISIVLVQLINPNFYNYFLWKFTTFNPMEEGGDSSRIRYISLINILIELILNPFYFIFGKGLGGFFEDKHMSFRGNFGEDSFSPRWIAEGKFYKPHGMILYSFLKYGLVMSTILFYSIVKFSYKNLMLLKKMKHDNLKGIAISLLINIPFFFIIMFSSKLQLMFGMMAAFAQLTMNFLLQPGVKGNGKQGKGSVFAGNNLELTT